MESSADLLVLRWGRKEDFDDFTHCAPLNDRITCFENGSSQHGQDLWLQDKRLFQNQEHRRDACATRKRLLYQPSLEVLHSR